MTDTHELAWAAGFWDGEGSIRTGYNGKNQYGYRKIHAIVGQRDRRVLDRFQAAVGFAKVYGPSFTQSRDGKPMYRWETGGKQTVHLLCWVLWPWLSQVKRDQFHNAFEKYHSMVPKTDRKEQS